MRIQLLFILLSVLGQAESHTAGRADAEAIQCTSPAVSGARTAIVEWEYPNENSDEGKILQNYRFSDLNKIKAFQESNQTARKNFYPAQISSASSPKLARHAFKMAATYLFGGIEQQGKVSQRHPVAPVLLQVDNPGFVETLEKLCQSGTRVISISMGIQRNSITKEGGTEILQKLDRIIWSNPQTLFIVAAGNSRNWVGADYFGPRNFYEWPRSVAWQRQPNKPPNVIVVGNTDRSLPSETAPRRFQSSHHQDILDIACEGCNDSSEAAAWFNRLVSLADCLNKKGNPITVVAKDVIKLFEPHLFIQNGEVGEESLPDGDIMRVKSYRLPLFPTETAFETVKIGYGR